MPDRSRFFVLIALVALFAAVSGVSFSFVPAVLGFMGKATGWIALGFVVYWFATRNGCGSFCCRTKHTATPEEVA